MAELAAKDPDINGITITDNPGGKPAILACTLAVETKNFGIEPIIHFTCKDKNRNDIESELYALARSGAKNLLVMTGDYPSEGYSGRPKPVFDMDAVHALRLINHMNKGEDIPSYKGRLFKATRSQEKLKEGYIPPCDWRLYRTSSWLNYFNDRDYSSKSNEYVTTEKKKYDYSGVSWS